MEEITLPPPLDKLVEGCSNYFKVSINFWVILSIFSIIVILAAQNGNSQIQLPFDIGQINHSIFYPFANLVISVLLIPFGSSFIQAIRTRKLIQKVIDDSSNKYVGGIHLQDLVDSMIYPSLSRVAPLAQVLYGENQFFPATEKVTKKIRVIAIIYYIVLKFVSIIIIYFLPGYAIVYSFIRGNLSSSQSWGNILFLLFLFLSMISIIILVQLFFIDILFMRGVFKRLLKFNNN